ncbi:hypothetical protein HGB25_00040 [Candidatus Saccharibacteria bacterium]|nr:hypothetical protein [Candidatus Saccharibacteria bacterium]
MKAKTNTSKKPIKSIIKRLKHGLKMAVIPHAKNDYRPHITRGYGLVAVVFVVIGLQFGYNAAKTGNVLGRSSDITVSSLLNQTNAARANSNLPQLSINSKLNQAAYLKAQDMFADQYWAHDAPDGTAPWKWLGDVGYGYDEAGENLAKNFSSTGAVMTAWLGSPEHRANVLKSEYKDVGFAVVDGELNGKPASIIVALYGMPADQAVAGVSTNFAEARPVGQVNILTQFAVATQSVTPAVIGGLSIIAIAMLAASLAHAYRRKLPKCLRQSWRRHHGLYKLAGLGVFALSIVFLYGGGQI